MVYRTLASIITYPCSMARIYGNHFLLPCRYDVKPLSLTFLGQEI